VGITDRISIGAGEFIAFPMVNFVWQFAQE
jgi:hypothetical protein